MLYTFVHYALQYVRPISQIEFQNILFALLFQIGLLHFYNNTTLYI